METRAKKLEHLCALRGRINTHQNFPLETGQLEKKKVAPVSAANSAGLFANIIKKWQQALVL